jgi:site-specific DNA-methyltransferase (cytosine-N4-specific)
MDVPHYSDGSVTLLLGDAREVTATLPDGSVDCIVTSPPYYGLRDYGTPGQYGLEPTLPDYVETLRRLFAEARRVLADDGTMWLNLGDSYAAADGQGGDAPTSGLEGGARPSFRRDGAQVAAPRRTAMGVPKKNLFGVPWRVAFALQDDGWILRNEIIWHKTNAMPESIKDRLSSRHEHLFLFSKSSRYWFDLDSIREPHTMRPQRRPRGHKERQKLGVLPAQTHSTSRRDDPGVDGHPLGRNPGDVWSIATKPYPEAHFAVFPIDIPIRCIKAGCKPGGTVLDPFSGSGTTGAAARQLDRKYIGIDLNPAYHDLAKGRFAQGAFFFGGEAAS